ncbi:MlaD family protein [Aquimonas voraii]|uniref:Phospholipid/cholesterol/gamma-HCH transport system substrate-binding protein n=1 Tax=Aquimonas voraii TaxID=265719 RepID=A0A1G6U0G1_9GAMM|nr:MlaD family protein [Aquimonas voraii]SDD34097.1 phospholipid/cholesterol/gamma-HCH transport system substrate-binding protein [Aquimonas voraii]
MKRDGINYSLVGAVVLVAFGLLLFALFSITGRSGKALRYHTHYANVTGLAPGAPVFYEGFRIGQVEEIHPDRSQGRTRYRVELAVRADWPIPEDSIAALQSTGLLADVAIAIREGESGAMLAEGEELASREGADLFVAMADLAGEVNALSKDRLRPMLESLAVRLESIGAAVDASAPALLSEAQALMGRLNTAADGVNAILDAPNREAIRASLANVQQLSAELSATQARADRLLESLNATVDENRPDLREAVADLERTLGTIARRIDSITHHLESSSRNMDEFTREIRRNPSRLIYTPPQDPVE